MLGQIGVADDVVESFERQGFVIFDPQIPLRTIDSAVADLERGLRHRWLRFLRHAPDPGDERVTDAWSRVPSVRAIALAPAVLAFLRRLYGREPRPFQTQNFKFGSQQGAHSDSVHFNTEPPGLMCAVWIALEDVDMDCGPLALYPGSHKLPFVSPAEAGVAVAPDQEDVPFADYKTHYEPYIADLIERESLETTYVTLRKGQAVVWNGEMLHAGSPVRVPGRTRRSQVTHYVFEGARLWTPLLSCEAHTVWRDLPQI